MRTINQQGSLVKTLKVRKVTWDQASNRELSNYGIGSDVRWSDSRFKT